MSKVQESSPTSDQVERKWSFLPINPTYDQYVKRWVTIPLHLDRAAEREGFHVLTRSDMKEFLESVKSTVLRDKWSPCRSACCLRFEWMCGSRDMEFYHNWTNHSSSSVFNIRKKILENYRCIVPNFIND
jgi:hypothetical protein